MSAHRALDNFLSKSNLPLVAALQKRLKTASTDEYLLIYKETLALIEPCLWENESDPALLDHYQHIFRELEIEQAKQSHDNRHHFVLFIPVADRPRQLTDCLDSILQLCHAYNYGGIKDGCYQKITVIIADDSKDENNIARNKKIVTQFHAQGLESHYFGQQQQLQQLEVLSHDERKNLAGILGDADPAKFFHKGSPRMRNIASLKLAELAKNYKKVLFYSLDSDQEFQVKVSRRDGDHDLYGINYFYYLDEIFSQTNACIVTGKVVGDPPVSPAVMAVNFLQDVIGFLEKMKLSTEQQACNFHSSTEPKTDDAAYHDMPELFGFKHKQQIYQYPCPLHENHNNGSCLRHFAEKLNGFFYGEHPTRKSYYQYQQAIESLAPARTVYPGNYVFNTEGLNYFIPFAPLKLRMNGPAMGRIVKAELKQRFISANLPMLHKRTVADTGASEFRPDVVQQSETVDLSGELERQYFGDVMLFSLEKLTAQGYPSDSLSRESIVEMVSETEKNICQQYQDRHKVLQNKKETLKVLLSDASCWWNQQTSYEKVRVQLATFIDNIEHNFGDDSSVYHLINSTAKKQPRIKQIVDGLLSYPDEKQAWERLFSDSIIH